MPMNNFDGISLNKLAFKHEQSQRVGKGPYVIWLSKIAAWSADGKKLLQTYGRYG